MMRKLAAGALGMLLVVQSGCIAVSAKEMNTGVRYEAVAVNGRIYVVDKHTKTARPVAIVTQEQATDP